MGIKLVEDFVTVPVSMESNGDLCIHVGDWKYRVHTGVTGFSMPLQNNYFVENKVLAFLVCHDWKIIIWRDGRVVVLFKNKVYSVSAFLVNLPLRYDTVPIGVDDDSGMVLEMLPLGLGEAAVVSIGDCFVVKYTTDSELIKCMLQTAIYCPERYRVKSTLDDFTVLDRYTGEQKLQQLKKLGSVYSVGIGGMCCAEDIYG